MLSRQGFLSPEMAQDVPLIRAEHERLFAIADRLNEIIVTAVSSARADFTVEQQRCAMALFLRSLELFQAVMLLAERGMVPPARSHVRSIMELAYSLTILQAEPDFVRQLQVAAALSRRLHLAQVLKPVPKKEGVEELTDEARKRYRAQIRELDDFIRKRIDPGEKPKRLETHELARRATATAMHRIVYPSGSASIHVNLYDILESYADDPNGSGLRFGPTSQGVDRVLSQCIHFTISAFEAYEHVFGREFREDSEAVRLWHEAMEIPLR